MEGAALRELAAAIRGHTAAVEELAAALREYAAGVRAGQAGEKRSKPIGTPVASIDIDNDTKNDSIDRSIDRGMDWEKLIRFTDDQIDSPEVAELCRRIHRTVPSKSGTKFEEDRRLVVAAAALSLRLGEAGREWLQQALEATRRKGADNPARYFRRCLATGLRTHVDPTLPLDGPGIESGRVMLSRCMWRLPIPEKWVRDRERERWEAAQKRYLESTG